MSIELEVMVDGRAVRVAILDGGGQADVDDLVRWTGAHLLELLLRGAEELLDDLNEGWLRPGQPPVNREGFLASLQLSEITRFEDGGHEWGFDDGGLFWGHTVLVHGDTERRLTDVELVD